MKLEIFVCSLFWFIDRCIVIVRIIYSGVRWIVGIILMFESSIFMGYIEIE